MGSRRTRQIWIAALLGAFLSVGPAIAKEETQEATAPKLSYPEGSDEAALLERAEGYWGARMVRSREVLDFYAPPELGGPESPRGEGGSLRYTDYEIKKVVVDGDRAGVVIQVQTALPAQLAAKIPSRYSDFLKSELTEEWSRVEGTWYKKPMPKGGLSRFMRRSRPDSSPETAVAPAPPEEATVTQESSTE